MRAAPVLALAAGLAACGQERGPSEGAKTQAPAPVADQGGRIVDLARVIEPAEEQAIARRLAHQQQADGRAVMVVLVEQGRDESLEQLGWAVGASRPGGPFLLLVDPAKPSVRVEGDLGAEQKAIVARAMQPDLAARRYAAAVGAGLTQLERFAP